MREVLAVVHALAGDQNRITHSLVMSSEVRCQHLSRQHCGLIIHEFVNRETAMLSTPVQMSICSIAHAHAQHAPESKVLLC